MLEVLKFFLTYTAKFIAMLFSIDVGSGMSLGVVMCIVFVFFPIVLAIVNFMKGTLLLELDERFDESRGIESWSTSDHKVLNFNKNHRLIETHNRVRKRRGRL